METFAAGSEVTVRTYESRLTAEETVRNAESRLGTAGYRLVRNNCEHFAAWCCTGRATSSQVRRWALATQGAVAWMIVAHSPGAQLAVLGTVGAGLYALGRPFRGR